MSGTRETPVAGMFMLAAFVMTAGGCGKTNESDAATQYRSILKSLQSGNLEKAYDEFMPASYDRDLNDIVKKARSLVGREDFGLLRDFLQQAGEALYRSLGRHGEVYPLARLVAGKVKDLPALLGIGSYESLARLSTRGLLRSIEGGVLRELAGRKEYGEGFEGLTVSVLETKGQWAKLRFAVQQGGRLSEDIKEVVLVDGRWVPTGWVADWPKQVAWWNEKMDELAAARKENPDMLRNSLATGKAALAGIDSMVDTLLDRIRTPDAGKTDGGRKVKQPAAASHGAAR